MKNILILFTDQQRWDTISAFGNTCIQTPNLDALAADFKGYEKQFAPLARPEEVKDAVGAGDSFISGYIAALLHGESRDECIKTGSAASAICISDFGASNWKVSYEQVRAFAAERA